MIGRTLGHYRIDAQLGVGGMSEEPSMDVVIMKSVGKGSPNDRADVSKVQTLLNQAQAGPRPGARVAVTGVCGPDTIEAIASFQALWPGGVDQRVDPGGRTLRRLNQAAQPLQLNPIQISKIKNGGYVISYKGEPLPKPYGVRLQVSDGPTNLGQPGQVLVPQAILSSLDITGRRQNDVIGADNLPNLLEASARLNLWGRRATITLYVVRETIVSRSNSQFLDCPVQPYSGALGPLLGEQDSGPKLVYTGIQTGRMIYGQPIGSRYYYCYGGQFETNNAQRGLNCITYVGAVFGVDPATGAMSAYGTKLVEHLGCTKCDMECKKEAEVREFFKAHPTGSYIVWHENHCMLVVNGVVHEYALGKGGYARTDAQQKKFGGLPLWVRKAPRDF